MGRRIGAHPTVLATFVAVNIGKRIVARNGDAVAVVPKFADGIQGSTETATTGASIDARQGRKARLFLQYCYCPKTRVLCRKRIELAAAALKKDVAQDVDNVTKWAEYTADDVHEFYRTGAIPEYPNARNFMEVCDSHFLEDLFIDGDVIDVEFMADVVAFVDDKQTLFKATAADLDNGNYDLILQTLEVFSCHTFRGSASYISGEKLEASAGNPCSNMPDDLLRRVWKSIETNFAPFGLLPAQKTSVKFLGFLQSMVSPAPEQLHSMMVGIGTSGGTQAELVLHAKRRLNGQGMRLVAMWAFIGRVLHLYPMAAEIFNRKQWSTYLYWHSFAVLCFLGFSPAQIKMLLEDNCGNNIDKNVLYKVTGIHTAASRG
eukprot:g6724.t1